MTGTEFDVLGAVLSGPVLSGVVFDVLGAVLVGALLDELESATDDVLAAVEATPAEVDGAATDELEPTVFATDELDATVFATDELDATVFGTDEVGGAESNWAAANPPSPRANPIAPAATIAARCVSRLLGESGSDLAMCASEVPVDVESTWVVR
ncbi:MAG TPA: hypothetical protein VNO51_25680 [Ilumatobacteraceae bacterium]|nr:hypothetical protein [Ilumatobacteraceae bacterium]